MTVNFSVFPRVRRGHGTTHPQTRFVDGAKLRNACPCVLETCVLNGGREKHIDPEANVKDWKAERGMK